MGLSLFLVPIRIKEALLYVNIFTKVSTIRYYQQLLQMYSIGLEIQDGVQDGRYVFYLDIKPMFMCERFI